MMRRVTEMFLLLVLAGTSGAIAQDKPTAPAAPVTQVSDADRSAAAAKQLRIRVIAEMQAVLQKEFDAAIADYTRDLQRLQAQCAATPGYDLSPALTCVAKKDDKK